MFVVHKSHSKNNLIDLINDLSLKIVFSHSDTKKDIQNKLKDFCSNDSKNRFDDNLYHIKHIYDLKCFLISPNPQSKLSIKEKKNVMFLAKQIINYVLHGKVLDWIPYYKSHQQIKDDLDYIKQYGDIPSVIRACNLMNQTLTPEDHFIPIISPHIQEKLKEKKEKKWEVIPTYNCTKGKFTLDFQ